MEQLLYRCAGPGCGRLKSETNRWWLMWTHRTQSGVPVLSLCEWNEEIAKDEAALHVCGEGCAEKLQSVFMGNILEHREKSEKQ